MTLGLTLGVSDGLELVLSFRYGLLGSIGIVAVIGTRPSNINCASPVKRKYQSEGNEYPSASKANHPPVGSGRSLVFAVTLKIAVPSSTSSNWAKYKVLIIGSEMYLYACLHINLPPSRGILLIAVAPFLRLYQLNPGNIVGI